MNLVLEYQGMGWLKRKAVSYATVTMSVKHFKDDSGVEQIEIVQSLTGGIGRTTESCTLDWAARNHFDDIFGPVIVKSRRISLDEVEDDFLKRN